MKIIKIPVYVSIVGLLATLPAAYANEIVTNCAQVTAESAGETDSTPNNMVGMNPVEDDESCAKVMIPLDYGDAPDPSYQTLDAGGGARHQLGTDVFLGKCVDADSGLLQGQATADDTDTGSPSYGDCTSGNDEDGVTVGELRVGTNGATVEVTASKACKLNAWIDWNIDGSWGGSAEQVFMNQQLNAGSNTLSLDVPKFALAGDTYARFRCSTVGNDGIGGEAADGEVEDYKVSILEAIPAKPVSVGDTIWVDADHNGQQDAGETPLAGVTVTLLDKDGNPARDLNNNVVTTVTTGADGKYLFGNLPEGDYIVRAVAPEGYQVTTGGADVDDDASNTDNNCAVVGGNVQTLPFTLTAGAEPTDDGDTDADSNLGVDCGFYQPVAPTHSIGNRVWVDTNNNGLADAGESPAGKDVKLELKGSDGAVITSGLTDDTGRYLFSGLEAGSYQVCVAASNFVEGGVLAGYTASTGGNVADANTDIDGDDNGSDDTSTGLCTNMVVLDDHEPTGEATATGNDGNDGVGTDDNRSNLTVDFGIIPPVAPTPVSVGDAIWVDANQNGQQDVDETPLEGVTVTLLDKDGNAVKDLDGNNVAAVTTGTDGKYLFGNLPEGDYIVRVAGPEGYQVTTGGADVDDDASNTDNNCAVVGGNVQTLPFTLTAGAEPTDDGDTDADSNLGVDCGFYQPPAPTHSIGNLVWVDNGAGDAAKANNGQFDNGEERPSGVTVELRNQAGAVLSSTLTAGGYYLFSGLDAGSYQVCVAASNFAEGAALPGYTASTGGDEADANSNGDNNDNGDNTPADGLCSNVVVLDGQEPTAETPTASGVAGDDGQGTEDARSNLTVDFGVLPPVAPTPVSVGDTIWVDADHNGQQDAGETPLAGVTVTLLDKDGNAVKDLDGNNVAAVTTGADGKYLFGNLPEGDYIVRVAGPEGYQVTTGGADVDDDASNTDNNCAVVGGNVQTLPFTLTAGTEPVNDGDTDANSNLSVDCGFYQPPAPTHSIGNRVWVDTNNNGLADVGESPVGKDVKLELKGSDGTVITSGLTDDTGRYLFSGLDAGSYQVCVAASNFVEGGVLAGYTASTGGNVADANTDIDGDDNGSDDTSAGLCTNMVVLDDHEPTGEATATGNDGDDGVGTEDARSNLTVDFGVQPPVVPTPVSVGDTIWVDANQDGEQDAGETPLAGVTVTLLDKDGNAVKGLDGNNVAAVTTGADGKYLFGNLPEGDYIVRAVAPEGYQPTTGGADVDENTSNTDNNCAVVGGNVQTMPFTLTAGAEPVNDGDTDADSNLGVDCGFYQPATPTHSIGNLVWVDNGAGDAAKANNGRFDNGEERPSGVTVELRNQAGAVLSSTLTAGGYYLFSGLEAGSYQVCVAASNFAGSGALAGYTASTGGDEADANSNGDNNDNGDNTPADGLCSNVVVLDDQEPTGETPTTSGVAGDDGQGTDDNRSNLTVDFGVLPPVVPTPVSVGDAIWVDANHNGQQDAGETPLAGVTVTLLDKDGNRVKDLDGNNVVAVTTGADGKYLFGNLPEGDYMITVKAPDGYVNTVGGLAVDDDSSNTDSNCAVVGGKVRTSVFNLTAGAEPTTGADGDDANGNMTVDCGFYLPKAHSIGNMVWVDDGAGDETKANNGRFDNGEARPSGVTVELRDKDGNPLSSILTAGGYYLFSGLEAGSYQVCVAASNFAEGGALVGYSASTGGDEADANSNGDNNDNGDNTPADGLCSNVVVLDGKEPTGETPTASGVAGDDGQGTEDAHSNLTVDFGLLPPEPGTPVAVGNQIWVDSNADGVRDSGEGFLAGATVTLTDAAGNSVTDLDGKAIGPHVTGADGIYLWDNLPEGDYVVTVVPPAGYFPTMGGVDADDDASDHDSNCRVNSANGAIQTQPFTLAAGTEPADDGDDANGNMTIDCGFYSGVSLGNKIWFDTNGNGQQDSGEPGISGISVSLMDVDGSTPATDITGKPVAPVTTGPNGDYLFTDLKPGDYVVVVSSGASSGYSLTQGGADPDTDPSNTDSNCKLVAGSFQTPAITLAPGTEPGADVDGDDENRNSTVDCGLLHAVNLGSRLWIDLNANGKQDPGEPGVPGATVTLLTPDGKPVTDIFGDVLQPQTTDADGNYFFSDLQEGKYVVKVIPPVGYLPTIGGSDPNDDNAGDSNGVLNPDGSISSKPIDLVWGEEPEDNGSTNTTVGFGLVPNLEIPTLSEWGMAIMSMLLAVTAYFRRRRED